MKKAIIVGGGTGGHVIPAIVVCQSLIEKGYEVVWIGSKKGENLEKKIIKNYFPSMKIYHIFSGKLRRKSNLIKTIFNIKNLIDIFQNFLGLINSIYILRVEKPIFIFSKGGFVSVPVAIASKITNIPFFTHESDYSVGLANKINLYFSRKFFYSFEDTKKYLPEKKAIFSSNPIRKEFFKSNEVIDISIKKFFENKSNNTPIILILGGSLGSLKINLIIKEILPKLCEEFQILHQTGEKKEIDFSDKNYFQTTFIEYDMAFCMKNSDLIVSRSGANIVFEIVATGIPAIFIPLKSASRGEQINNANYFAKKAKIYTILDEDKLSGEILYKEIKKFFTNEYTEKKSENNSSLNNILIDADKIIICTIEKELSIL